MRPLAEPDGHDSPRLIDELVPCLTAVIDEIVIRFEYTVGEPVAPHKFPDILDRAEFGAIYRLGAKGNVERYDDARRHVPASLIDQEDGLSARAR